MCRRDWIPTCLLILVCLETAEIRGALWINEVMPVDVNLPPGASDWVEIVNTGDSPMNLTNVELWCQGAATFAFPDGTYIPPGGHFVVTANLLASQALWGTQDGIFGDMDPGIPRETVEVSIMRKGVGPLDAVIVPPVQSTYSYGRFPDGEPSMDAMVPTPRGPNQQPVRDFPPTVAVAEYRPLKPLAGHRVQVYLRATDPNGDIDTGSVRVVYRVGQGGGTPVLATPSQLDAYPDCIGADQGRYGIYQAEIPPLPDGAFVELFGVAQDQKGLGDTSPVWRYQVGRPAGSPVINEVVVANMEVRAFLGEMIHGHPDTFDEYDDWIELYNPADHPVSLYGKYLTDDLQDLRRWSFGIDAVIPPRGYLIVWCDAQVFQNFGLDMHTNFKMNQCNDEIILVDSDANGNRIIDAISFHGEKTNFSVGRILDGQETLGILRSSPGGPNRPAARFDWPVSAVGPVVINEVCVDNHETISDSTGEYGDWIELLNVSGNPVNLGGWGLVDRNRVSLEPRWVFPTTILEPGEHLLVWCDNDDEKTDPGRKEFHASLELNRLDDGILLLEPAGAARWAIRDSVSFIIQMRDITIGRFPDGSRSFAYLRPSPGLPNSAVVFHPVRRGDFNRNGRITLADVIAILRFAFASGPDPRCLELADTDADGNVSIADAAGLLALIFLRERAPVALPLHWVVCP